MRARHPTAVWWIGGIAIWTGLAGLAVIEAAIYARWFCVCRTTWRGLLSDRLTDWYSYGLFMPLLVWATIRWPLDRRHVRTRLLLHLGLIVGVVVARSAIVIPIREALGGPCCQSLADLLAKKLISEATTLAALCGVLHAIEYYRRYRDREGLALQLRASLSDARLQALRAQINPHFLFNTLNAATALLYRDAKSADRMLTQLADLLRVTLRNDPSHETSLREELDLLERYLAIMRVRFAGRVSVTCDVDPSLHDALVPSFVLQPLVENAFEHGMNESGTGNIRVLAEADDESLVLSVSDDGSGMHRTSNGHGVGLANTRRRLEELYGDRATLALVTRPDGGATVEIRMPLSFEAVTR